MGLEIIADGGERKALGGLVRRGLPATRSGALEDLGVAGNDPGFKSGNLPQIEFQLATTNLEVSPRDRISPLIDLRCLRIAQDR
jgi:hypothetical protein